MWRVWIIIALLLTFVGCGSRTTAERLNGTWANPLATYQFDFGAHTMTITTGGKTKVAQMSVVTQDEKSVTVQTDGDPIVIMLTDDATAIIMQAKKLPLQLKRQS